MTVDQLQNETLKSEFNVAYSENGAKMYATTGKALLDLSFKAPQLRATKAHLDTHTECNLVKAEMENRELFAKFLFFLRDARGGIGERNAFRNTFLWFCNIRPEDACKLLKFVPEYGRWDDLVYILYNTTNEMVKNTIVAIVSEQFAADIKSDNPSLMGKWLPSINAGKKSKAFAKALIAEMNKNGIAMNDAEYRKTLSQLRKKIQIVETNITEKNYAEIDYERVPSVANTRYAKLFLKYDNERRSKYLESIAKGEKKINASVSFPHDIYKLVSNDRQTAEAMWNALPDFVNGDCKTLVVRDGSGSMLSRIPNSTTSALDVASALCVYFAERMTGEFHNTFITFSSKPQLVKFRENMSLYEKKRFLNGYDDCYNTDIEKTFDLVLSTAVSNHLSQEEMPGQLLIVSDMEFDEATRSYDWNVRRYVETSPNLFEHIARKYAQHGYKLPKLVFWNVNSRTGVIPVIENEMGVTLVSGYSAALCKMVLSEETDPWKTLLNVLLSERYAQITLQ